MKSAEYINKMEGAIQGLLGLLGKRVSRTQIVKLIYLADNLHYEYAGRTITGVQYVWHHYGPNAVDNSIAQVADQLVEAEQICRAVGSYKGRHIYNYWVNDPHTALGYASSVLSDGERHIVLDVARKYGRYNASDLATLSKKTKPFENARQYDILRFKQNDRTKAIQDMLNASPDFLEEVRRGFGDLDAGQLVSADEL